MDDNSIETFEINKTVTTRNQSISNIDFDIAICANLVVEKDLKTGKMRTLKNRWDTVESFDKILNDRF